MTELHSWAQTQVDRRPWDNIRHVPPRVWNKRDPACPRDAVYIGRPSWWGNPFSHIEGRGTTRVASRKIAVDCYEIWLEQQPKLIRLVKAELRGKDLVCWCKPATCHGDVLLKLANS